MIKLFSGGLLVLAAALLSLPCMAAESIKLSTTVSLRESGLLEHLLPEFSKDTGISVQVTAKGNEAVIRDGQDGKADVVLAHDLDGGGALTAGDWGAQRHKVMHSDFVLIGPAADPAGIKSIKSVKNIKDAKSSKTTSGTRDGKDVTAALRAIARKQAVFVSCADESAAHARELGLWKASGVLLQKTEQTIKKNGKGGMITFEAPKGSWYLPLGQDLNASLAAAEQKAAYTLIDRSAYIRRKSGKAAPTGLEILEIMVEGDPKLATAYSVIPVDPKKHAKTKTKAASAFAEWLVSPKAQALIAGYTLEGQQLFFPDAIPGAQ